MTWIPAHSDEKASQIAADGLRTERKPEQMTRETDDADRWANRRAMAWISVVASLLFPALLLVTESDQLGAIAGQPRWDWPLFYPLAEAVKKAAIELRVPIVWGGVWDKQIAELGDMEKAVENYVARRKKSGLKAFVDGPHFELDRKHYQ